MKKIFIAVVCSLPLFAQAGAAFRLADAAVVWNPETGFTDGGRHATREALVDLTNAIAKVTGHVPAVYEERVEKGEDKVKVIGQGQERKGEQSVSRLIDCSNNRMNPSTPQPVIYLGDTKAARAAGCDPAALRRGDWRLKAEKDRAFLFANSGMGTARAASDFVERWCGYHFLTTDGRNDPFDFNPSLEIPVADITVRLAIYHTMIYTQMGSDWNDFYRRRRTAWATDELEGRYRESYQPKDFNGRTHTCHSSFCYVQPEVYFKDHPEYFSLINGKRQYKPVGQLCMTNPDVRRICLEKLLGYIEADRRKYPDNPPLVYDLTHQDNMDFFCECENCQAAVAKYTRGKLGPHKANYYGGDAGLQLEFVNWIAERVAPKYPDVNIRVFAYVSTRWAPKEGTIAPHPMIRVEWDDLYGESEHYRPMLSGPFNEKNLETLRQWQKITKNIRFSDYMLYGGPYSGDFPECAPDAIAADAKFCVASGFDDMFMEMEARLGGSMLQPFYLLNYYLLTRFYENPETDLESAIGTYCRTYGKGAAKMREAIGFLRRIELANPAAAPAKWHQRVCPWRTRENWEAFRAIVRAAYDAEDAGPVRGQMARVLCSAARELARIYGQIPSASAEKKAAQDDYLRYGMEYLDTCAFGAADCKKMRHDLQTAYELFNLKFKNVPDEVKDAPQDEIRCADYHRFGGAVDDPDSETGKCRVWRLGEGGDVHRGFPVPCWMSDIATDLDIGYKITAEMAAKDEKYHWYRLGKGWVGSQGVFALPGDWSMSFRFADWYILKDGLLVDPNWYDVYLSAKFTGPAYVPGSTKPNGIWIDRLLLRRTAPPAEDGK